jgi:hypothetical protein
MARDPAAGSPAVRGQAPCCAGTSPLLCGDKPPAVRGQAPRWSDEIGSRSLQLRSLVSVACSASADVCDQASAGRSGTPVRRLSGGELEQCHSLFSEYPADEPAYHVIVASPLLCPKLGLRHLSIHYGSLSQTDPHVMRPRSQRGSLYFRQGGDGCLR